MKIHPILFIFSVVSIGAALAQERPYFIYHISHDSTVDAPAFNVCNEKWVLPYYAGSKTSFNGERPALLAHFHKLYVINHRKEQTGYVTIRFIVNCEGHAGRFRLETFSADCVPKQFDNIVTQQLLNITRNLQDWKPATYEGKKVDTYYYLTFKITEGKLTDILP
jgi:hypothetical protein